MLEINEAYYCMEDEFTNRYKGWCNKYGVKRNEEDFAQNDGFAQESQV